MSGGGLPITSVLEQPIAGGKPHGRSGVGGEGSEDNAAVECLPGRRTSCSGVRPLARFRSLGPADGRTPGRRSLPLVRLCSVPRWIVGHTLGRGSSPLPCGQTASQGRAANWLRLSNSRLPLSWDEHASLVTSDQAPTKALPAYLCLSTMC